MAIKVVLTRLETHKRYEFVKLCSTLVKQGFCFSLSAVEKNTMVVSIPEYKELFYHRTKTPFVESWSIIKIEKGKVTLYPNQWADRKDIEK